MMLAVSNISSLFNESKDVAGANYQPGSALVLGECVNAVLTWRLLKLKLISFD